MIGAKTCSKCDCAATVFLNDRPLCTEHAFAEVKAAKGFVKKPRPVK